ncbi:MAG: hypothetical protein ACYDE0_11880 [Acidiferrobacterales bacterium]
MVGLSPAPNYGLSASHLNLSRLTDGRTLPFPPWAHEGSVGWQAVTPVMIRMRLTHRPGATGRFTGTLSFHCAKGTYAGVYAPRRIDLYEKTVTGKFTHVGSVQLDQSTIPDRNSFWVSIPVRNVGPDLVAMIHAQGNYLMLDQIRWSTAPAIGANVAHPTLAVSLRRLRADSISRLKRHYRLEDKASPRTSDAWMRSFGGTSIESWVAPCWGTLPAHPDAKSVLGSPKLAKVIGYSPEHQAICVGLLNPGRAIQAVHVTLGGKSPPSGSVRLSKIKEILAANGHLVFDPVELLPASGMVTLKPLRASYLMLSANLAAFPVGNTNFYLYVTGHGGRPVGNIPVSMRVVAKLDITKNDLPAAGCWAYTNDMPIWANRRKAMADLVSHGINVFFIPPEHIPLLTLDGNWDAARQRELEDDLRLYAGHGIILLYLGWEPGKQPQWLGVGGTRSEEAQKQALGHWLARISGIMSKLGIKKSEWALYPMDEIAGSKIAAFIKIASWIRELDPTVQIYADPTTYPGYRTSLSDLKKLVPYVNLWQPNLVLAKRTADSFFSRIGEKWWIYSGPGAPAKAAKPLQYRLLGWQAWALGASGVGVWAYSDTGGSSAWDDFDGNRPGYAMVYEGPNGPVSSRRWVAFRKGLEDYQLLAAASHGELGMSAAELARFRHHVRRALRRGPVSMSEITKFRDELLGVPISRTNMK